MSDENMDDYAKNLNDAVNGGGGCVETWDALNEMREQRSKQTDGVRRRVLKGAVGAVGLGLGSSAGFAGSAAAHTNVSPEAIEQAKGLARPYQRPANVHAAVETHASDLIEALHAEEYLDHYEVSKLVGGTMLSSNDLSPGVEGNFVTGVYSETAAHAHIQVNTQLSENERLAIIVQPEKDRSYAMLRSLEEHTDAIGSGQYPRKIDSSASTVLDPAAKKKPKDGDDGGIIVQPQCVSAVQCLPDPDGFGCANFDCIQKEFQCCNNYQDCYTEVVGSCRDCCTMLADCDSIWGECQ